MINVILLDWFATNLVVDTVFSKKDYKLSLIRKLFHFQKRINDNNISDILVDIMNHFFRPSDCQEYVKKMSRRCQEDVKKMIRRW
jgi:hypothetical protein